MIGVFLHGPGDLRVEQMPHPGAPAKGEVLLHVMAAGLCGSDLHTFLDARIGDTVVKDPLVLGHEFSGRVEEIGADARDGNGVSLRPGMLVAVDPAHPCGVCEMCLQGNPNLCWRLHFCGLYPDHGCFREFMRVPAQCCFPLPDSIDDEGGALLEPLGVALHAVDLARVRIGDKVALLGAGPIGLLLLQALLIAGAGVVYVADPFAWRRELARKLGGIPLDGDVSDSAVAIHELTLGRGVDVAIEAAWGGAAIQQGADAVRMGGRLVLVGIPGDDVLSMKHSVARRKGLTIRLSRRMKHTYPRAIALVQQGKANLKDLVSHRFQLTETPAAFALNTGYRDSVVKIIIKP